MADRPLYLVFAGVNGAGKSTLYRSGLWRGPAVPAGLPRVNSDEILVARGWDSADPRAQLRAGREAVALIRGHLAARRSFNQETTLCGHSPLRTIRLARERGYRVAMHYVGVESPRIANERIAHRAAIGGHFVDPGVVEERWRRSIANLIAAAPLCDELSLFDNTALLTHVALLAAGEILEENADAAAATWHREVLAALRGGRGRL